jgi:hypothetical protein
VYGVPQREEAREVHVGKVRKISERHENEEGVVTETGLARVERSDAYVVGVDDAISPKKLTEQVALIQNVMRSVMKDGEHFGKIPGCGEKPSLLKPGAEKLCFTFRMDP